MKTELWLSGNESRTSESILNLQETFIIDDQLAKWSIRNYVLSWSQLKQYQTINIQCHLVASFYKIYSSSLAESY